MAIKYLLFSLLVAQILCQVPDFVMEFSRHGVRAPFDHAFGSTWEPALGQLTPTGMRQHFLVGASIRNQYPHLFTNPILKNDVEIIANRNCDRCHQSANSQLYGITQGLGHPLVTDATPPYDDPYITTLKTQLNNSEALPHLFYPTVVRYTNPAEDMIFLGWTPPVCPKVTQWQNEDAQDAKATAAWKTFAPLIAHLNKYVTINTVADFLTFGDHFYSHLYEEKDLPGGMPKDADLLLNMSYAYPFYFTHTESAQEVQIQTGSYGTVKKFIEYLTAIKTGASKLKFVLLLGHDYNLVKIMPAFGVLNSDCIMENYLAYYADGSTPKPNCIFPFFATNFKMELYNTSTPYVKAYYRNHLVTLCASGAECPFDEFITFLTNSIGGMTITQFREKCGYVSEDCGAIQAPYVVCKTAAMAETTREFAKGDIAAVVLGVFCAIFLVKIFIDWGTIKKLKKKEAKSTSATKV